MDVRVRDDGSYVGPCPCGFAYLTVFSSIHSDGALNDEGQPVRASHVTDRRSLPLQSLRPGILHDIHVVTV